MNARGVSIRQIAILGGLLILVLLIMDFNNRMAELHRLSEQEKRVAAQATSVVQTRIYLETQIAYATSDGAVEAWARSQGHMIRPGDNPVVPLAPEPRDLQPTPTPQVTPESVQNWEVWRILFFDQ